LAKWGWIEIAEGWRSWWQHPQEGAATTQACAQKPCR